MEKIEIILKVLTPTQRRRMIKYLDGQTLTEIAISENVSKQAISKCLISAKRYIINLTE